MAITGIGLLSPLGNERNVFWNNLKNGVVGLRQPGELTLIGSARKKIGLVDRFVPEEYFPDNKIQNIDQVSQRVIAACKMALNDARVDKRQKAAIRFFGSLGSVIGALPPSHRLDLSKLVTGLPPIYTSRMMEFRNQTLFDNLCRCERFDCPGLTVSCYCSSGLHAVAFGFDAVRSGKYDMAIVGGYELFRTFIFSHLSDLKLLSQNICRPFDERRDGMYIGEGVGIVILEKYENAQKRGVRMYGEIIGCGMGYDAYHITRFSTKGSGIKSAVTAALSDARIATGDVDYIIADAKGIRDGDLNEVNGLRKVFGEGLSSVPITSLKSQMTHCMGASGPLSMIAGIYCLRENMVLPTKNYERSGFKTTLNIVADRMQRKKLQTILVNAIGFGGNAAAVLVRKN